MIWNVTLAFINTSLILRTRPLQDLRIKDVLELQVEWPQLHLTLAESKGESEIIPSVSINLGIGFWQENF